MKDNHLLCICIIFIIFIISYSYYKQQKYSDYVIYIPNFLSQKEYSEIKKLMEQDSRPFEINKNGLIKKTIIDKKINKIFYSLQNKETINQYTNNNVFESKVPIEYRIYQLHNGMNWHKDTLLYDSPQYECVYTIQNTSDSKTEYIDYNGEKHSVWTKPNSLMIVRANGYFHHVKPVTKGKREILKLIYTPSKRINRENYHEYNNALHGNT
jgi:hypothetical protein